MVCSGLSPTIRSIITKHRWSPPGVFPHIRVAESTAIGASFPCRRSPSMSCTSLEWCCWLLCGYRLDSHDHLLGNSSTARQNAITIFQFFTNMWCINAEACRNAWIYVSSSATDVRVYKFLVGDSTAVFCTWMFKQMHRKLWYKSGG